MEQRPRPEAIKIQTYGTLCKYCRVEKAFSFLCRFSLLGFAQENCTTRSSYVQYSTLQQAKEGGVSMGANSASNFLGKENKSLERPRSCGQKVRSG